MSTGVKELDKTRREEGLGFKHFHVLPDIPSPGGGGAAGSLHPWSPSLWPGPWDAKLVGFEVVACGGKAEGGCWDPSLSAEDEWNLQRISNQEPSER